MISYFVYNLGAYSGAAFQALNVAKIMPMPVLIFNIGSEFGAEVPSHIQVVNVGKSAWYCCLNLLPLILKQKIKVIHFHGQFLFPMFIAKLLGVPYVLKTTLLGDDDFDSLKNMPLGTLRLWFSKRCAFNVVLSQKLLEINQKYVNSAKVKIIPNGVQSPNVSPTLYEKHNHFYFCGIISERKQTLKAIQVFAKEYSYLDGAKMFIIGPNKPYGVGKEIDLKYMEFCKQYVEDSGLSSKIFFTGLLPQNKVFEIIRSCKALLFFSNYEGMPNVVLEAMAANCVPIISSMQGIGNDLIRDGSGFVCDNTFPNIDQLNAMIRSKAPFNRAVSCYSFSVCAQELAKLYKSLG